MNRSRIPWRLALPLLAASALLSTSWLVAAKRAQVKALPEGAYKTLVQALEKTKAQMRAHIERLNAVLHGT